MPDDRRNDIGGKFLWAVALFLLGIIFTISITTANNAMEIAQSNKLDVKVLNTQFINLCEDIQEIKGDIKYIKTVVKR